MELVGIESFKNRKENKSKVYSHENTEAKFPADFEKQFKANKTAWKYFQALAPSYQKVSKHWVMTAKQETTKLKRLQQLIQDSEAQTNQWKDNKYKNSRKDS